MATASRKGAKSGNPKHDALIEAARAARAHAYAPYSKYRVGAALLARDGRTFVGVNVENCAYPTCICAETNVLGTAVAAGAREFDSIAICTEPNASGEVGAPCGNCRQALAEFGLDLEVLLVGPTGAPRVLRLRDLLPEAFTPAHL